MAIENLKKHLMLALLPFKKNLKLKKYSGYIYIARKEKGCFGI
jgi:hypothetical protein